MEENQEQLVRFVGKLESQMNSQFASRIDTDQEQKKVYELRSVIDNRLKLD